MMKIILVTLILMSSSPIIKAQKIVFFLHNAFLEHFTIEDVHPEYGKCEYKQILAAFKNSGLTVISEIRPKNTNPKQYSKKIIHQIDSLIARGAKASDITVVGTSRGGYIAQYVSTSLKNKDINYVLIGCCSDEDITDIPEISLSGNILSIYEKSDLMAQSCSKLKEKSKGVSRFKEIELTSGLKHGFLFKALDAWLAPSIRWAKQEYK
ncbi:MAG: alpha/beta hydrolase [Ignavibacteria bacterium]|nr:alpha/beta hydrolase [Ignavibacteria bacterium]